MRIWTAAVTGLGVLAAAVAGATITGIVASQDKSGLYNLACYTARSGDIDAAFYWLQQSAAESGVDANWAKADPDLETLRADDRWAQVETYLVEYNAYWAASGIAPVSLILPNGYDGKEPLPILIGLHGLGGGPKTFVDSQFQAFADARRIAVLGVSGTRPLGPTQFSWSEDVTKDTARVDAALKKVSNRVRPAEGKILLFGFSQGAAMAMEIAASAPDRFAGAIAMSPGKRGRGLKCSKLEPLLRHQSQGYVAVAGAAEHPGTVQMTRQYARAVRSLKSRVFLHLYEGMDRHTFPPDFSQSLGPWVQFILSPHQKEPETVHAHRP